MLRFYYIYRLRSKEIDQITKLFYYSVGIFLVILAFVISPIFLFLSCILLLIYVIRKIMKEAKNKERLEYLDKVHKRMNFAKIYSDPKQYR
jgi:1,4-dihydroxy-2-naphthoate octaprenyltransferase